MTAEAMCAQGRIRAERAGPYTTITTRVRGSRCAAPSVTMSEQKRRSIFLMLRWGSDGWPSSQLLCSASWKLLHELRAPLVSDVLCSDWGRHRRNDFIAVKKDVPRGRKVYLRHSSVVSSTALSVLSLH